MKIEKEAKREAIVKIEFSGDEAANMRDILFVLQAVYAHASAGSIPKFAMSDNQLNLLQEFDRGLYEQ